MFRINCGGHLTLGVLLMNDNDSRENPIQSGVSVGHIVGFLEIWISKFR